VWERADGLDALFEIYDGLSEEFRAELPVHRTWMLVPENEEASA
jgi:predicted Mrr-cat superfamily restriction endonuclease